MNIDRKFDLANDVLQAGRPDHVTAIHLIQLLVEIINDLQRENKNFGGSDWRLPPVKEF